MLDNLRIGSEAKKAKEFTPCHPNPKIGKDHGISLMLHGKHSELYRNAIAEFARKTSTGETLSLKEAIKANVTLIVSCCAGWIGVTGDDNKPDKYTPQKLTTTLLDDDFAWLRVEAEKFIRSDVNYF